MPANPKGTLMIHSTRGRNGGIPVVTIASMDEFLPAIEHLCGDKVILTPSAWAEEMNTLEQYHVLEITGSATLSGATSLIELSPDGSDYINGDATVDGRHVTIGLHYPKGSKP